jgi:NADH-quinone oxidoreductase subunit N
LVTPLALPAVDWLALLPVILISGLGCALLASALFVDDAEVLGWGTIVGLLGTTIVSMLLTGRGEPTLGGTYVLDGYAIFFTVLILVAGALVVLMSMNYLDDTDIPAGEYYALLAFAIVGMLVMAAGRDLVVIFIGLEVMSISVYILAGAWRTQVRSNEAALKYFLMGAFATGFLLYGIALVYGATGSFRLDIVAERLGSVTDRRLLLAGLAMLLVGFGFKVAAVPFHMWTPDAYEGAPTSVTAFMAVAVKSAAFAAFARVLLHTFGPLQPDWWVLMWVLAALTMTVGNVLALAQHNIKRMLAYSSIAHAGYILVALTAGGTAGGTAALFYLVAYAFMNIGAFGVVLALARRGHLNEEIDDLAGLGFRSPLLGTAMAVFMLSLTGIPPLAGFAGKFYVFSAAVSEGYVALAVIGVLNSVVSAGYYIRVLVTMFMTPGTPEYARPGSRPYLFTSIVISAALTVLIGVFPAIWLQLARMSFLSIS